MGVPGRGMGHGPLHLTAALLSKLPNCLGNFVTFFVIVRECGIYCMVLVPINWGKFVMFSQDILFFNA